MYMVYGRQSRPLKSKQNEHFATVTADGLETLRSDAFVSRDKNVYVTLIETCSK